MNNRVRWFSLVALMSIAGGSISSAHGPAREIEFEVVTVKPAGPNERQLVSSGKKSFGLEVKGNHADIGYDTLADLAALAFAVKTYQVTGPDWIRDLRYDVVATS